jgi:DNA-directed RNA polymerase
LFIAFCFEYINYKNSLDNNLTYFISHFPIQLDATCNGYQHLSLLTGDEPLAGQLNLISDDIYSAPKDFYTYVTLKFKDYLKQIILEAEKFGEDLDSIKSYKKLLNMKIQRKLVKLPIMVKPYNASLYQMVEYIKKEFEGEYINLNKENLEINKDLVEVNTIIDETEEVAALDAEAAPATDAGAPDVDSEAAEAAAKEYAAVEVDAAGTEKGDKVSTKDN